MAQITDTTTTKKSATPATGAAAKPTVPELHGELPGAKARDWIRRDAAAISPSYTRSYGAVIERGEGCTVWDVDGNAFVDVSAGIAVCATGHCHPKVVQAIQDQAAKLIHMSGTDFYYPSQIELAEKLASLFPGGGPAKVFFGNSGTEAIEAGMKLARYHTGRMRFLAFRGAFHGRTMGSLSLTASKATQRKGFGPVIAGVHHLAYPDPYRGGPTEASLAELEHVLDTIAPPEEVAAIVVEPIQGEALRDPPDGWFEAIEAVCRKHRDPPVRGRGPERMGGRGRCGDRARRRSRTWSRSPGSASGYRSASSRGDLMDWKPAPTPRRSGEPDLLRGGLATIELWSPSSWQRAGGRGISGTARGDGRPARRDRQRPRQGPHDRRRAGRGPDHEGAREEARDDVINRCFEKGLLILGCGPNTVRWAPPLVIDEATADTALEIFEDVLTELAG
jgi:4-aminobutyrate aminotransferase